MSQNKCVRYCINDVISICMYFLRKALELVEREEEERRAREQREEEERLKTEAEEKGQEEQDQLLEESEQVRNAHSK